MQVANRWVFFMCVWEALQIHVSLNYWITPELAFFKLTAIFFHRLKGRTLY